MAAGTVASITLFMLWYEDRNFPVGRWRYALPVIMLFLSGMMVSEVKYPSFKKLDMRATRPFLRLVLFILALGLIIILRDLLLPIILPLLFTTYLIYGFIRTRISRKMRQEIEDEDEEDEETNNVG